MWMWRLISFFCNYFHSLVSGWLEGKDLPASGSLVQVITKAGVTSTLIQ
jgi:hypothetical protein